MSMVAALAPRPPTLGFVAASPLKAPPPPPLVPLAENTYKLQVSISREMRDQLREAQDLLGVEAYVSRRRLPAPRCAACARDPARGYPDAVRGLPRHRRDSACR